MGVATMGKMMACAALAAVSLAGQQRQQDLTTVRLPGSITDINFARDLGRSIQGLPLHGRRGAGAGIVPYLLLPSYLPPPPPVFLVAPPPPVVINQTFVSVLPAPQPDIPAPPAVTTYRASEEATPAAAAPAAGSHARNWYMIALGDGSVHETPAYWYEDGDLFYVDADHITHGVAFRDVDVSRSRQLTRERGLEFRLPE